VWNWPSSFHHSIFDHIRGQNARAQKHQAEDDEESDEGSSGAGAPAPASNLIRHEPSVAPAASRGVADPARLRYSRSSRVLRFRLKVRVLVLLIGVCVCIVAEPGRGAAQVIVENYCAASRGQEQSFQGASMDVEIQASLPKLKKQGRLHALRRISALGRITYEMLRFEGDGTVKNQVIARYLTAEAEAQKDQSPSLSVTPGQLQVQV